MTKRQLENHLKKATRLKGGQARLVSWIGRPGPSYLVLLPGAASAWVEIQSSRVLSSHQILELCKLELLGQLVYVVTCKTDIDLALYMLSRHSNIEHLD